MPIGSVADIIKNDTFKTYRERVNAIIALVNTVQKQSGEQSSAPTVNNDVSEGYDQGSFWLHYDNTKYDLYVCVSNADGAAVWNLVSSTDGATFREAIGATTDSSFLLNDQILYDAANWVFSGSAVSTVDTNGVVLESLNDNGTYTQDLTDYIDRTVNISFSALVSNNPAGAAVNESVLIEVRDGSNLLFSETVSQPGQSAIPLIVNRSLSPVIADGALEITATKTAGQTDQDVIMSVSGLTINYDGSNYTKEQVDELVELKSIAFVDVDSSLESNFSGFSFFKAGNLDLKNEQYYNKEVVLEFGNPLDGSDEVYIINTFLEQASNVPDGTFYRLRLSKQNSSSYDARKVISIVPNSADLNAGVGSSDYTYYGQNGTLNNPEIGRIRLAYDNAYVQLVAKNGLWHIVDWNRALPLNDEYFADEIEGVFPGGPTYWNVGAGNTAWFVMPRLSQHYYELDERNSGLSTDINFLRNDIKRVEVHLSANIKVEEGGSGGVGQPLSLNSGSGTDIIEFGYKYVFDSAGVLGGVPIIPVGKNPIYHDFKGEMNVNLHLFDIDVRDLTSDDLQVQILWRNTNNHTGGMEITFDDFDVTFEIVR